MKTKVVRSALVGILVLGLALPVTASASFFNWGCRYQGTWFGVLGEENTMPAGWMVTTEGRSFWHGTNNLVFTADSFDPKDVSPDAVRTTTMRGNWMRIGYNTLMYTTTGMAVGADGKMLYIAKVSGFVDISEDCKSIHIRDNMIKIYLPDTNPYTGNSFREFPGPDFYGKRAFVQMP